MPVLLSCAVDSTLCRMPLIPDRPPSGAGSVAERLDIDFRLSKPSPNQAFLWRLSLRDAYQDFSPPFLKLTLISDFLEAASPSLSGGDSGLEAGADVVEIRRGGDGSSVSQISHVLSEGWLKKVQAGHGTSPLGPGDGCRDAAGSEDDSCGALPEPS